MNPELWQRIEPLYRAALQTPAAERTRFIAQACGSNVEWRTELQRLFETGSGETSVDSQTTGSGVGKIIARDTGVLTPGQLLLGRFRIVTLLGSGGMGDVYEATDLELGRIALKTIRSQIAANPEMLARFRKEVQLARKVSGPHVCRIHELFVINSGTADGTPAPVPSPAARQQTPETPETVFLTMEFLEGMTLSDTIAQSGAMTAAAAEPIAVAICAGLDMIHSAGIIHRDLKSRNIMLAVRNGVVTPVLMDFGLAHELEGAHEETSPNITRAGAILGTPDYMAPEQFQGKAVTPATDVYALGIVLYEMLTGKQPFSAPTPFENAVLRGRPVVPPSSISKQVPRRWDEVIRKCLEFDAALRYQSAGAVAEALRGGRLPTLGLPRKWRRVAYAALLLLTLSAAAGVMPAVRERLQGVLFASAEKHIAVLPIEFVGGNAQTEALGNGLMDSLSGELSNLSADNQTLWVVPASEVRREKVTDPEGALRVFGATIAVKGSVQRHDQAVHLALTLIDTKKMRQIGFTEVNSPTGDLVTIQNEAVERLGRLMNVSSIPATREITGSGNRAAYEDYLTGVGYMERYDKPGNLDLAIASLQKAVATDDHFALALAKMGDAYRMKYQLDQNPHWLQQGQVYADRAAQIDASTPTVFVALAKIHEATGKHDLAVQEFQRALQLDPRNAEAISGLAVAYEHAGRLAEAEKAYKQAIDLRPDYWDGYERLGNFYDKQGKSSMAIDEYNKAIQLTPDNAQVYANLGGAYVSLGDIKLFPEAERALKKSIQLAPTYSPYANLGLLYTLEHRYPESVAANEKALQMNDHDYAVWENLVCAYQWVHREDKAAAARNKMLPLVEEAARVNPMDAQAQAELAVLYAHSKLGEKSSRYIQTAMALAPDDPIVLSSVADAYQVLGNSESAAETLNHAFLKGYTRAEYFGDPDVQGLSKDPQLHLPLK